MPATLTIDGYEELQELYDGVQEDFEEISFLPVMQEELDHIADFERGLFDRQQSPDGSGWAANAPATIEQKGHSQVLRGIPQQPLPKRKGVKSARRFSRFRLSRSLTSKSRFSTEDAVREAVESSSGAALAFGTNVEYSVFNEDRPHVGINDQHLDKACGRVAGYAIKQLAKG